MRSIYETWVERQQVDPRHQYVMPFRATFLLLLETRQPVAAWRVLSDAINDPESGLQIVRLRYSRRSA
ncbi:hypothetical protein [Nocardioides aromaticivorans]|uniref:hypothetical protein n=1 Tax=Nocardioides aromaticivorans TaxID=200618 RepID=UPI001A8D324A|nr:hypothetical protein [Nocardioides aromaticivorans]